MENILKEVSGKEVRREMSSNVGYGGRQRRSVAEEVVFVLLETRREAKLPVQVRDLPAVTPNRPTDVVLNTASYLDLRMFSLM